MLQKHACYIYTGPCIDMYIYTIGEKQVLFSSATAIAAYHTQHTVQHNPDHTPDHTPSLTVFLRVEVRTKLKTYLASSMAQNCRSTTALMLLSWTGERRWQRSLLSCSLSWLRELME